MNSKKKSKNNSKKKTTPFWLIKSFWFFLFIGLGLFFLLILTASSSSDEALGFSFANNLGFWQAAPGTKVSVDNNAVKLTKTTNNFFLAIPGLNLQADSYDVCELILKSPIAYEEGRLFFISPYNHGYDMRFSYRFDTGPANKFNKIYLDLKGHPAWKGNIKEVLIVPAGKADNVTIKEIKFIRAGLGTKIKAWWAEFTRYSDPLLGSNFALASPIFLGQPFNSYFRYLLFWGTAVVFVLYILAAFLNLPITIRRGFLAFFFMLIVLVWFLLDLRNSVYYLKAIGRNVDLYWGKPLIEKRAIAVGDKEFVYFMKFCDENIPLKAEIVNLVAENPPGTPGNYLAKTQFGYLLRPRLGQGAKKYYIVYKQKLTQEQLNETELFKRFSNQAYILVEK